MPPPSLCSASLIRVMRAALFSVIGAMATWERTERVVVEEGATLGQYHHIALQDCQKDCEQTAGCRSLSYGRGDCFLKDKCITGGEPTVDSDARNAYYVTWFQPCGGPTPAPTPQAPCVFEDRSDADTCRQAFAAGKCTTNEFIFKCQRTCGYCNTTGPWFDCTDHAIQDTCANFRQAGGCARREVGELCPATCGFCTGFAPPEITDCKDKRMVCSFQQVLKNSCDKASFRSSCRATCQDCSTNRWSPEQPSCVNQWNDCDWRKTLGECGRNWCKDHCAATCDYCLAPKAMPSGASCFDRLDNWTCGNASRDGRCIDESLRAGCQKTCKWCSETELEEIVA